MQRKQCRRFTNVVFHIYKKTFSNNIWKGVEYRNRPFHRRNRRFLYLKLSMYSVGEIPFCFWKCLHAVERCR